LQPVPQPQGGECAQQEDPQEKKNEKSKYDYKINCLSEIPQLAAKLMR
jgi:hypothetical protein